ncbi:hypothetical protein RVR34_14375 [Microcystis aeruginosa FBCC-A68]
MIQWGCGVWGVGCGVWGEGSGVMGEWGSGEVGTEFQGSTA